MRWTSLYRRVSSKWITHTLILSIIPVILFGTIIYYWGSKIVQHEIQRSARQNLLQVQLQIEKEMKNVEQMVNRMAINPNRIKMMNVSVSY